LPSSPGPVLFALVFSVVYQQCLMVNSYRIAEFTCSSALWFSIFSSVLAVPHGELIQSCLVHLVQCSLL